MKLSEDQKVYIFYVVYAIIIAVLVFSFTGCKSYKNVSGSDVKYVHDTTVVEKRYVDTTVVFEADTASARLLLECDENNNALVSIIDQLQGERVNVNPIIEYVTVKDSAGMIRRQAYIDMVGIATEQSNKIAILEESLYQGKAQYSKSVEMYERKVSNGYTLCVFCLIVGFALGIWLFWWIMHK